MPSEASAKDGFSPKIRRYIFYVYLIQSESEPSQRYVGYTTNLQKRLKDHNAGHSKHTSKFSPWGLICSLSFKEKRKAQGFEHYLKSGSGKAFANKRFW